MKKYDKNSLIGFVLMAVILIVFNTFFFPETPQEQALVTVPTEAVVTETQFTETTVATPVMSNSVISEELKSKYGVFASAANGTGEFQVIENDKLKITVANKGGRIVSVILKEYQTFDSLALDLFDARGSCNIKSVYFILFILVEYKRFRNGISYANGILITFS